MPNNKKRPETEYYQSEGQKITEEQHGCDKQIVALAKKMNMSPEDMEKALTLALKKGISFPIINYDIIKEEETTNDTRAVNNIAKKLHTSPDKINNILNFIENKGGRFSIEDIERATHGN